MPKRASGPIRSCAAIWSAQCVVAWIAVAGVSLGQSTGADPRQTLAASGLTNLGDAWLCAGEIEARRWFDALEPLERQYQATQRVVDDRVKSNENAKKELAHKKGELKKVAAKIAANDPAALGPTRDQLKQTAKELEEQISRLRRAYKNTTKLAEYQPARDEVIRLANARAALTIAAAALRRQLDGFPPEYERLSKVAAVTAALKQLGPPHRLGTGRNYAADAAERLSRIDKVTQSNVVPIYRDDDHARLLTIVDGATPVTFSIRHSDGPTHLPHSLAKSLNLLAEDAPEVSYTVGNRKLKCRRIQIKSIAFGNVELRDVEALALPPEGEDLGAKLGNAAYAGHYFDVDFSQLKLTVIQGSRNDTPPPATNRRSARSANGPTRTSQTPKPEAIRLPSRTGNTPGKNRGR